MTLQFPSSPLVGQTFPDPIIEGVPIWTWDGEKWAPGTSLEPPLSTGGGVLTGPLVLAGDPVGPLDAATKQYVDDEVEEVAEAATGPTMGVTDASNAAPGEVGEAFDHITSVLATEWGYTSFGNYANAMYVMEPLAPGDWDLECSVWLYMDGYVTTSANAVPMAAPAIGRGLMVRSVGYGSIWPSTTTPLIGGAPYVQTTLNAGAGNVANYLFAGPVIVRGRLNFSTRPSYEYFHASVASGLPWFETAWTNAAASAKPPMMYFRVRGRRMR